MICPYCKMDNIPEDTLYCIHCSHPLYSIEIPEIIYIKPDNLQQPDINIKISNHGNKQLEIYSLAIDNKAITLSVILPAGSEKDQPISFNYGENITSPKRDIEVTVKFRLGHRDITSCCYVTLCPYPEIDFTIDKNESDEYKFLVGPTRGYSISLPVELKNSSFIEISHIRWELRMPDGNFVGEGEEQLESIFSLPHNGSYRGEIRIPLPISNLQSRKEYKLIVKILSPDILLAKEIKIACLDLPDISIIPIHWTQEGKKLDEFMVGNLFWNLAADIERLKNFIIRIKVPESQPSSLFDGVKIQKVRFEPEIQGLAVEVPQEPMAPGYDYQANMIININRNYQGKIIFDLFDNRKDPPIISREFQLSLRTFTMTEYPYFIGMDFGTTNSTVAIIIPDESKEIDPFGNITAIPVELYYESLDPRIMPSIVLFSYRDEHLIPGAIGRDVPGILSIPASDRKLVAKSMKRNIIEGKGLFIDDKDVKEEASEAIITELLRRAIEYVEEQGYIYSFPKICLAVPTMAGQIEIDKIVLSCEKALQKLGIEKPNIQVVDESYAALLYFFEHEMSDIDLSDKDRILVYDFGGGTTDLTLIEHNGLNYEVVGVSGNATLGGDDVTKEIVRIMAEMKPSIPDDNKSGGNLPDVSNYELEKTAENVKLSMNNDGIFKGNWPNSLPEISRQELVKKIKDYLRPEIAKILDDIGLQVGKVDGNLRLIVLAGGSSKIEGFEDLIEELLPGVNIVRLGEPKLCVAMGALMNQRALELSKLAKIPFRVLLPLLLGFNPGNKDSIVAIEKNRYFILIEKGEQYGTDDSITKEYQLNKLGYKIGSQLHIYFQYGVGKPRLRYVYTIKGNESEKIRITLDRNRKIQIEEV